MSIQMVISLSFTAVAVVCLVFMGLSLSLRFTANTEKLVEDSSQRVISQVNLNLDSYLRRMMRVSNTMYYRVVKDADIAEDSLTEGMNLLYEENRDALVSVAVFDSSGNLISAVPLSTLKEAAVPEESAWFRAAMEKMENLHFSTICNSAILSSP